MSIVMPDLLQGRHNQYYTAALFSGKDKPYLLTTLMFFSTILADKSLTFTLLATLLATYLLKLSMLVKH